MASFAKMYRQILIGTLSFSEDIIQHDKGMCWHSVRTRGSQYQYSSDLIVLVISVCVLMHLQEHLYYRHIMSIIKKMLWKSVLLA